MPAMNWQTEAHQLLLATQHILDDVRGNINPERGFHDELERDVHALRGKIEYYLGRVAASCA